MKPSADAATPIEAECKFRVDSIDVTKYVLSKLDASFVASESHCDTYLRHPCRDFRSTDEALRIREIDGLPYVTYKGPRLAGPIKIRSEIELPMVPNTVPDWLKIWQSLGFVVAAQVRKTRQVYKLRFFEHDTIIALDRVATLGDFVEIEQILNSPQEVEPAQANILMLAEKLGLSNVEKRSYLGMLLSQGTSQATESSKSPQN